MDKKVGKKFCSSSQANLLSVRELCKITMAEYSICKCIRTDKPAKRNGKYPIYLRIRVGGRESKVPTGMDVWRERWDNSKKQPKDKPLLIRLNQKILDLDLCINRALADGQPLTLDLIKSLASGKRQSRPEVASFYDYYLGFVERKRKEGLREGTINGYLNTLGCLREFRRELSIGDVSLRLIEEFDRYMDEQRGNSAGGRAPKHRNLRAVILDIQKHKIPVDNPYQFFKMAASEAKEVYLDRAELATLAAHCNTLPIGKTQFNALQMYLFSCYSGLRLSDALDLCWEHVDYSNNLIRKTMVKTGHEVITPLFPLAKDILAVRAKLAASTDGNAKVFQNYSEPVFNQTLREQAKAAGIDKYLTYHTARHTFATQLVTDGVDIYKIQKYLGHRSVDMTQRYLKYNLSIAKESAVGITTFSGDDGQS